jgi:hypothetical protein
MDRRKAALKANMARRKQQAQARATTEGTDRKGRDPGTAGQHGPEPTEE